MELNKNYSINIIGQLKTGSFVIIPKLNEIKSEQYLNYREHLLNFILSHEVAEWFEELDYPQVEIGKVSCSFLNLFNI